MIAMKRIFAGILIVCMLCTLTACASAEKEPYPKYYSELCDAIGKTEDVALEILNASGLGLTPDRFGTNATYFVPVEITFQGITFETILLGFTEGVLYKFSYAVTLEGNGQDHAESISEFAFSLREEIGKSHMGSFFEDYFSPAYLAKYFSEKTSASLQDTWIIGDLKTESAKALYDTMMKTARHDKEDYHENLALRMDLTVAADKSGAAHVKLDFISYLSYGSDFITANGN